MGTSKSKPFAAMLNPERRIQEGSVSLVRGNGCIQGIYPIEPCRHAGVDVADPGERKWYYIRNQELLIIDLGGEFTNGND
jgi:hypothetical protein